MHLNVYNFCENMLRGLTKSKCFEALFTRIYWVDKEFKKCHKNNRKNWTLINVLKIPKSLGRGGVALFWNKLK